MADDTITESIPASAEVVFALLHDYDRRLEWDTLLRAAYLEPGFPRAALGAVSVCVAKRWLGGMAVRTRYTTFQPGRLAAVKMLNSPAFFARFAASIRHTPTGPDSSLATYRYTFRAKPRALSFVLHPIMAWTLRRETTRRLRALRVHFGGGSPRGNFRLGPPD